MFIQVAPSRHAGPADYVDAFDTPTLVEVWRTAPHLQHDRNATIREVIVAGKHRQGDGRASELSQPEVDDLIEFVLSL